MWNGGVDKQIDRLPYGQNHLSYPLIFGDDVVDLDHLPSTHEKDKSWSLHPRAMYLVFKQKTGLFVLPQWGSNSRYLSGLVNASSIAFNWDRAFCRFEYRQTIYFCQSSCLGFHDRVVYLQPCLRFFLLLSLIRFFLPFRDIFLCFGIYLARLSRCSAPPGVYFHSRISLESHLVLLRSGFLNLAWPSVTTGFAFPVSLSF